jgi:anti-sigma B factor antagonist
MEVPPERGRPLGVRVLHDGDRVLVALRGTFDVVVVEELQAALDALTGDGVRAVEIDLREVDFLDSSSLRTLVRFNARAREEGIAVAFVRGPARVQRIFEVVGVAGQLAWIDRPAAAD